MHSVRMRVSVWLGLWLGLGLILHKTSTLNINRNPQNVLFQVALGDIFGRKKNMPLLLLPLLATFNKLNIMPSGGFRAREREREREKRLGTSIYTPALI